MNEAIEYFECYEYTLGSIWYKDADGLVQECCNSSQIAVELLQSCPRLSVLSYQHGSIWACRLAGIVRTTIPVPSHSSQVTAIIEDYTVYMDYMDLAVCCPQKGR